MGIIYNALYTLGDLTMKAGSHITSGIYNHIAEKEINELVKLQEKYGDISDDKYQLKNVKIFPDVSKYIFKKLKVSFLPFVDKIFGPDIYLVVNTINNEFIAYLEITRKDNILILYIDEKYRHVNIHKWLVSYAKKHYGVKYILDVYKNNTSSALLALYGDINITELGDGLAIYDISKINLA